jgi:hypothetical protein
MRLLEIGVLAFRALSAAVLSKSDDIAEACSKTVMCSSSKLFESTMVQREVSPWVRKGFSVELPCPMCLGALGFKSPKFTSFRSFSRVCVRQSRVSADRPTGINISIDVHDIQQHSLLASGTQ